MNLSAQPTFVNLPSLKGAVDYMEHLVCLVYLTFRQASVQQKGWLFFSYWRGGGAKYFPCWFKQCFQLNEQNHPFWWTIIIIGIRLLFVWPRLTVSNGDVDQIMLGGGFAYLYNPTLHRILLCNIALQCTSVWFWCIFIVQCFVGSWYFFYKCVKTV